MGEKCSDKFRLEIDFHVIFRDLLHAANLRHGTDGFISPPKKGVLGIFSPLKNPTASGGFEIYKIYKQKIILVRDAWITEDHYFIRQLSFATSSLLVCRINLLAPEFYI